MKVSEVVKTLDVKRNVETAWNGRDGIHIEYHSDVF